MLESVTEASRSGGTKTLIRRGCPFCPPKRCFDRGIGQPALDADRIGRRRSRAVGGVLSDNRRSEPDDNENFTAWIAGEVFRGVLPHPFSSHPPASHASIWSQERAERCPGTAHQSPPIDLKY